MTGSSHPKFVVHCVLSQLLIGFADDGRIFDASHSGPLRTTLHTLIDGDFLTLKLQIPQDPLPVSVKLAKVTWVQESRFGVELLMMDVNERVRLSHLLDDRLPRELELHESQSELTITAAD